VGIHQLEACPRNDFAKAPLLEERGKIYSDTLADYEMRKMKTLLSSTLMLIFRFQLICSNELLQSPKRIKFVITQHATASSDSIGLPSSSYFVFKFILI